MSSLPSKNFQQLVVLLSAVIVLTSCQSKSTGGKEVITGGSRYHTRTTSKVGTRTPSYGHVSESTYGANTSVAEPSRPAEPVAIKQTPPQQVATAPDTELTAVAPVKPVMKQPKKALPGNKAGKTRKNIVVTAKDGDQIVVADDDNVTVKGNGGIVMISGRCDKLKLESNKTEVYCDVAKDITITGDGNSVTLGTVSSGMISGNGNNIIYESSFTSGIEPNIKSTGEGNMLNQRSM